MTTETTNANANATNATITPEQLEKLGLTQEVYNSLPEQTRIVLLKGLKPSKAPKQPIDLWSNSALLPNGNDHSKAMVALSLLLRSGHKESEITQQEWTRATLALIVATRAYKVEGKLACAEASTRTAVGQARRWREVIDPAKLMDKTKRIQLSDLEQAMFDYYRARSLWPGKKDDADKRMSVMAADLLREEWRKRWTENNDWRPCKEEQPEPGDNDNDNDGEGED
jgi:hypothetical protein